MESAQGGEAIEIASFDFTAKEAGDKLNVHIFEPEVLEGEIFLPVLLKSSAEENGFYLRLDRERLFRLLKENDGDEIIIEND